MFACLASLESCSISKRILFARTSESPLNGARVVSSGRLKQVQRRHARGRGALNGMAVPFGPAQPAALASAWQGVQMRDRVGSAAFPGMVRDQHDCAFAPNVSSVFRHSGPVVHAVSSGWARQS